MHQFRCSGNSISCACAQSKRLPKGLLTIVVDSQHSVDLHTSDFKPWEFVHTFLCPKLSSRRSHPRMPHPVQLALLMQLLGARNLIARGRRTCILLVAPTLSALVASSTPIDPGGWEHRISGPQGPGLGVRPKFDAHVWIWPGAEAMKQLDVGIGNTLVSVCGNSAFARANSALRIDKYHR